jgi:hypothetical protein
VSRAVLGSALRRTSNRETVEAIDRWLPELRRRRADLEVRSGALDLDQGPTSDGRVLHRCPDGYWSILALAETCEACGWSPSLSLPALEECVERTVFVLGWEDALLWWSAGLRLVEGR